MLLVEVNPDAYRLAKKNYLSAIMMMDNVDEDKSMKALKDIGRDKARVGLQQESKKQVFFKLGS